MIANWVTKNSQSSLIRSAGKMQTMEKLNTLLVKISQNCQHFIEIVTKSICNYICNMEKLQIILLTKNFKNVGTNLVQLSTLINTPELQD